MKPDFWMTDGAVGRLTGGCSGALDAGMRVVRTGCFAVSLAVFLKAGAFAELRAVPESFPAERYKELIEDSPFSLATPVAAVVEDAPGFASSLYVVGVMKMRDGEGREVDYVSIKSRTDNTTFSLSGSAANKDGISLVGVEWNEKVGKSKVSLKKGSEAGTLEFDEAILKTPGPAPQVAVRPQNGQVPPAVPLRAGAPGGAGPSAQPGLPKPPSTPGRTSTTPAPKTGGVPATQFTPGQPTGPVVAPPSSLRQRIRPIGSKP